jgi:hypothetical protein
MNGKHLEELALARLSDGGVAEDLAEHARWCPSCRRIAADYDWLRGEVKAALVDEAAAVHVPGPDWEGVSRRLKQPQTQAAHRLPLVAATAVLIVCVMCAAPPLLGRRVQAQPMAASVLSGVPEPVAAADTESAPTDERSLAGRGAARDVVVSLPFVPPPTPPEADA